MNQSSKRRNNVSELFSDISPLSTEILALVEAHQKVISKKLRRLGLYRGQEMLLKVLELNGGCSQNELATYLCLDHSTITKSIGRMEKAGLVTRVKSKRDKRVTMVNLTENGTNSLHEVDKIWIEVEELAQSHLSKNETSEFIRLAKIISNNLQE